MEGQYVVTRPFPGSPPAGEVVTIPDERRAETMRRRRYVAALTGSGDCGELEAQLETAVSRAGQLERWLAAALGAVAIRNLPSLLADIGDVNLLDRLYEAEVRDAARDAIVARLDRFGVLDDE